MVEKYDLDRREVGFLLTLMEWWRESHRNDVRDQNKSSIDKCQYKENLNEESICFAFQLEHPRSLNISLIGEFDGQAGNLALILDSIFNLVF